MAAALISSVGEIERALAELRTDGDTPAQRTSVLTHIAWIPADWAAAAEQVLEGLAQRHPSRTILLYPEPGDGGAGVAAEVARQTFSSGEDSVCAEVVRIHLRGASATAPASVVLPLVLPDLPVFLRWRGLPGFASSSFEQLTGVADRLIVDSGEWQELRFADLAGAFERTAVSDLAWRRTHGWRVRLAERWPFAAGRLRVEGPLAEAALLAGWLRSRLGRELELEQVAAEQLRSVSIDGEAVAPPGGPEPTPADLLSGELDAFGRDLVYEGAVTSG